MSKMVTAFSSPGATSSGSNESAVVSVYIPLRKKELNGLRSSQCAEAYQKNVGLQNGSLDFWRNQCFQLPLAALLQPGRRR